MELQHYDNSDHRLINICNSSDPSMTINKVKDDFFTMIKEQTDKILKKGLANGLFVEMIMNDSIANPPPEDEVFVENAANLINGIDEMLKITLNNEIILEDSATDFFSSFFGVCFGAVRNGKDIRDNYERLTPTQQCKVAFDIRDIRNLYDNSVIPDDVKEIVNKFPPTNVCYICNTEIIPVTHFSAECEHIIDAFTAVGIGSLIQESNCYKELVKVFNTNVSIDEGIIRQINLYLCEYANSHRCCNRVKSRDLWIKYEPSSGSWTINEAELKNTLGNIYKSNSHDCGKLRTQSFGPVEKTFIDLRKKNIIETYLNPIISILNNDRIIYENYSLRFRCQQLLALKLNMDDVITQIISGKTVQTKQQRKIKLIKPVSFSNALRKYIFYKTEDIIGWYKQYNERIKNGLYENVKPPASPDVFLTYFYTIFIPDGQNHRLTNPSLFRKNIYEFFFKPIIINLCNELETYLTSVDTDDFLLKLNKENLDEINRQFDEAVDRYYLDPIDLIEDFIMKTNHSSYEALLSTPINAANNIDSKFPANIKSLQSDCHRLLNERIQSINEEFRTNVEQIFTPMEQEIPGGGNFKRKNSAKNKLKDNNIDSTMVKKIPLQQGGYTLSDYAIVFKANKNIQLNNCEELIRIFKITYQQMSLSELEKKIYEMFDNNGRYAKLIEESFNRADKPHLYDEVFKQIRIYGFMLYLEIRNTIVRMNPNKISSNKELINYPKVYTTTKRLGTKKSNTRNLKNIPKLFSNTYRFDSNTRKNRSNSLIPQYKSKIHRSNSLILPQYKSKPQYTPMDFSAGDSKKYSIKNNKRKNNKTYKKLHNFTAKK